MTAIIYKDRVVNEDEFNEGVRNWWDIEFSGVLNNMEFELRDCAKDAWDLNEMNNGDKQLLCSVPVKLYNIVSAQYGPDAWKDKDFIECYQRYMKQTFLAKPSSEFGK